MTSESISYEISYVISYEILSEVSLSSFHKIILSLDEIFGIFNLKTFSMQLLPSSKSTSHRNG